jgi:hypothetical protein
MFPLLIYLLLLYLAALSVTEEDGEKAQLR